MASDAARTQVERNRLGQFATPAGLAADILEYARRQIPASHKIRFLEPAFGGGSFYAALLQLFPPSQIEKASGYEIDPRCAGEAARLWANTLLDLRLEDFTQALLPSSESDKANLLICNPPYVRHHHLSPEEKGRLQSIVNRVTHAELNGRAGLYCYFLLLAHGWMAHNCLAGWLIPSEFMDVQYGQPIREYLTHSVTLLHIHRFDPTEVQFDDSLVSSAVVWIRNKRPETGQDVHFSYGGTLLEPKSSCGVSLDTLRTAHKWTRFCEMSPKPISEIARNRTKLSDLFRVKRGLATGANKFFILTPEQAKSREIPDKFLTPILPSPRYLMTNEVKADDNGHPALDQRLFLLDCDLPEHDVRTMYPRLWQYLQTGAERGVKERHLCRHRTLWYSQENRPPSPLLCTYMGSNSEKPFRFILNHSVATASNGYLVLYPIPALQKELMGKGELLRAIWQALNDIPSDELKAAGRVYGGGLYKIEPKELASVSADRVLAVLSGDMLRNDRQSLQ